MDFQRHDSPFQPPNLDIPSTLVVADECDHGLFASLEFDLKPDNPYTPAKYLEADLQLPNLDTFEFGLLEDVEALNDTITSSDDGSCLPVGEHTEDVWAFTQGHETLLDRPEFRTWETFQDEAHGEPCSAFVSEAGPKSFDISLRSASVARCGNHIHGRIARADVLFRSLLDLGCGRQSVLFFWDEGKGFVQLDQDVRAAGLSLEASQSLIAEMLHTGTMMRRLRTFSDNTYLTETTSPAHIALAKSVAVVLDVLEAHVRMSTASTRSLLQLQNLFSRPKEVLLSIEAIVAAVEDAMSNEQVSSAVLEQVQISQSDRSWLHPVLSAVFARASKPWMDGICRWIGLLPGPGTVGRRLKSSYGYAPPDLEGSGANLSLMASATPSDYLQQLPEFVSEADGAVIIEIGRSLRLIEEQCPDHPIVIPQVWNVEAVELSADDTLANIQRIIEKTELYTAQLTRAIKDYSCSKRRPSPDHARKTKGSSSREDLAWACNDAQQLNFLHTGARFLRSPEALGLPDELYNLTLCAVQSLTASESGIVDDARSLHLHLDPIGMIKPLLSSQARLVNAVSLRLLLRSNHLRKHLDLQHSFQLIGNGTFLSRLRTALFDPDIETAERQSGVLCSSGTLGLRLGAPARRSWPPASSELRLSLMGILSDSYHSPKDPSIVNMSTLPGDLSFAIRSLPDEEIEKISNPQSLAALDFLRLQYNAPTPVNAVITPVALQKYDNIFQCLLRLIRVHYVTTQMYMQGVLDRAGAKPGQPRMLRLGAVQEMHVFVSVLMSYCFDLGVAAPWRKFMASLDRLHTELALEDADDQLGTRVVLGLDGLRLLHENTLDDIRGRLLLRRRDLHLREAIDAVLTEVLEFYYSPYAGSNKAPILHGKFRKKLSTLCTLLHGSARKQGSKSAGINMEDREALNILSGQLNMDRFAFCGEHDIPD
ncbi:hypothetical protein LTR66_005565 [Elasticomyces elasticus]|nr:hypothetical protein LTR66_005565 [Elasticomyces elasticus]